jgi:branched-chain amino acid transport system permease protein
VSSFFAGVGGAMLAMYQNTVQAKGFTTAMTYEILLIVVIGGIGSISGSCLATFLYVACSEWWLRFLDGGKLFGMSVPFFRDGFRKVVFSVVIMVIVLFFSRGIMGDRELSFAGLVRRVKRRRAARAAEGGETNEGAEKDRPPRGERDDAVRRRRRRQ